MAALRSRSAARHGAAERGTGDACGVSDAVRSAGQRLEVQYEWSAAEAQRAWRDGSVRLARAMLERQARDLGKTVANSAALLLSASPYLNSD